MASEINLVFEVHQPFRLNRNYRIGEGPDHYFNEKLDRKIFERVSNKCYEPMFEILAEQSRKDGVAVNLSVSSSWINQALDYRPGLISEVKNIPEEKVEFIGQAYNHSISSFFESKRELSTQISRQKRKIISEFGQKPEVAVNTELILDQEIAETFSSQGYSAIFAEQLNEPYQPLMSFSNTTVLPRHRKLTDDIAYRFSDESWSQHPLTPERYVDWIESINSDTVTLFMDIETFGEHHWKESGIFEFWKSFVKEAVERDISFVNSSELLDREAEREYSLGNRSYSSWADRSRDSSAWIENEFQKDVLSDLENMQESFQNQNQYTEVWRKLMVSDHLHHMSMKSSSDGEVHNYFSYFESPSESYACLSNILDDFKNRISGRK